MLALEDAFGDARLHRASARVVGGLPPRRSGGVAARGQPEVRGAHRARRRAGCVCDLPHQVGVAGRLSEGDRPRRGGARGDTRGRA
jgi:hypothetical protein